MSEIYYVDVSGVDMTQEQYGGTWNNTGAVKHPQQQMRKAIDADALIEWLEGLKKDEETPATINEARRRYGHNDAIDTILKKVRNDGD